MSVVNKVIAWTDKSWANYTGPDKGFSDTNVVFGNNGHGKSSLAQGIKAEFLKTDVEDNLRFFNKSYVEEYLLLDESGKAIRGVKANFGKEDVDVEKEIKELSNARQKLEKETETLESAISKRQNDILHIVSDVFARRKGNTRIQSKPTANGYKDVLRRWNADYQNAASEFPNEDFSSVIGDDSADKALSRLEQIAIFTLPEISEENLKSIVEIAATSYDEPDIPSAIIMDWLETGLGIHADEDQSCKFCGGALDKHEITIRLDQYRKAKKSADEKKLRLFLSEILAVIQTAESIVQASDLINNSLSNGAIDSYCSDISNSITTIKKLMESEIERKLSIMNQVISLDFVTLMAALSGLNTSVKTVNDVVNKEKAEVQRKIDQLAKRVRGAIGFELNSNKTIKNYDREIIDKSKELVDIQKQITDINTSITRLEFSKSDISDFAAFLNEVFESLGFPFIIVPRNSSYYLVLKGSSGELSVTDISEGEKNLLALLFFYYELFSDNAQQHFKSNIKLVIVDDPTSSMDNMNKYYVLELMHSIMRQQSQTFVFTHVWDDYCNLAYGKESRQDYSLLETRKTFGVSNVFVCKTNITPYNKLFVEIFKYSELPNGDPSIDVNALHMPNAMRRVLEEYLRFNANIDKVTSNKEASIGAVLYQGKNWENEVRPQNKAKVIHLLHVINILSHRVPDSVSSNDVHQAARFLMNRIQSINPSHFAAMKTASYEE